MAFNVSSINRKTDRKPPRTIVYGGPKIGKTTLLASQPNVVFIQTEDGEGNIEDMPRFPLCKTFADVEACVMSLCIDDHDFESMALDSIDWLEPMIVARVCEEFKVTNIEKANGGYGKGYVAAEELFKGFLDSLTVLRDERKMAISILAHSQIKRFNSPDSEPYDRYQMKLREANAKKLEEWADIIGYLHQQTTIKETEVGFNKTIARAEGNGQLILSVQKRPAFDAGNRYNMPADIYIPPLPMSGWDQIAKHIPYYTGEVTPPVASTKKGK